MPPKLPGSMPWQIYQAYLSGPHALFRLFEDAFGRLALYGTPDPDQQQREIDDLSAHIGQLKAQIEKLQAEVSQLRHHNFRLGRRNAELEALVAKDSHNSSRRPQLIRSGRSAPEACAAPLEKERADRLGIKARRSGSRRDPTASSSIGPANAATATVRWLGVGSCAISGSRSGRLCWRSSR